MTSANTKPTPMKLLKVISLLLDYPHHELFTDDTFAVCQEVIQHSILISPEVRQEMCALIAELQALGEMEAQAQYDSLFERGRSLSLWLFEHVHGESRDRGQAMVDLMAQYEAIGFVITAKELPDYLPMYLEYLAYRTSLDADDIQTRMDIADISHILVLLAARLSEKHSAYASVFKALLQIAGKPLSLIDTELQKLRQVQAPADDSPAAIDGAWEEEMVNFMANDAKSTCPSSQTQSHIAETLAQQAQAHTEQPIHWVDFKDTRPSTHTQGVTS